MEVEHPPEIGPDREERVRGLGFDPRQLTPSEQVELIELHALTLDEFPATPAGQPGGS